MKSFGFLNNIIFEGPQDPETTKFENIHVGEFFTLSVVMGKRPQPTIETVTFPLSQLPLCLGCDHRT